MQTQTISTILKASEIYVIHKCLQRQPGVKVRNAAIPGYKIQAGQHCVLDYQLQLLPAPANFRNVKKGTRYQVTGDIDNVIEAAVLNMGVIILMMNSDCYIYCQIVSFEICENKEK